LLEFGKFGGELRGIAESRERHAKGFRRGEAAGDFLGTGIAQVRFEFGERVSIESARSTPAGEGGVEI